MMAAWLASARPAAPPGKSGRFCSALLCRPLRGVWRLPWIYLAGSLYLPMPLPRLAKGRGMPVEGAAEWATCWS